MKIVEKYFSKKALRFKAPRKVDIIDGMLYSYRAQNNIYSVLVIGGGKYYSKNEGAYTSRIDEITKIHREIESHYVV